MTRTELMNSTTLSRAGPAYRAAEIPYAYANSKGRLRGRFDANHPTSTITFTQWWLAVGAVGVSAAGLLTQSINDAVTIIIVISALSLLLAGLATYHSVHSGLIGQAAMLGALWIMFFMEAVQSALRNPPFSASLDFHVGSTLFDVEVIHRALLHLCLFQLMLLVGFAIPSGRYRFGHWFTSRVDIVHGRLILQVLLAACILLSLGSTYLWDWSHLFRSMLGSYGVRFGQDSALLVDPPFLAYILPLGLYGAAVLFVDALEPRRPRRYLAGAAAAAATLLVVLSGSRHIVLVILVPVGAVILRRSYRQLRISRVLVWMFAIVLFFWVFQIQVRSRDIGWQAALAKGPSQLLNVTELTGQFSALLFAESLVPLRHDFFLDPTPLYFVTQWIPRRYWLEKPEDQTYRYFNDEFTGGHPDLNLSNVTPSIIGQFYMNFGIAGVCTIGCFLGILCRLTDNVFVLLKLHKHEATAVFVATLYAFIINSLRLFSPFYLMYSVAAFIGMIILTRGVRPRRWMK